MSDLLTRIRTEIDARLEALRPALAEAERLEEALRALQSGGPSRSRTSGGRASVEEDAPAPAAEPAPKAAAAKAPAKVAARSGAKAAPKAAAAKADVAQAGPAADGDAPESAAKGGDAKARAPKGANREAILAVIKQRPGVSPAEVSSVTKIAKPTVDSTISRLKREGLLVAAGFGGVKLSPEGVEALEALTADAA